MGVLDQITKMKGQGIPDEEIINELARQGISPREINDALKQAQIKYAVSNPGDEMQASIMPNEEIPAPTPNQGYQQRTYEGNQQQTYAPMEQQEQYAPQEGQQYYQPGGGYTEYAQPTAGIDTDTVMEIADQLFSEKIKKFQKQLDLTTEASTLLHTKLENVSDRLKKIETIIDKLQIAILEKVGSYGQNLESVKKEMSMMQDSFSKMISPSREREPMRQQPQRFPEEETSETQRRVPRKK